MTCQEKPEQKEYEESRNRKRTVLFAASLGLTIIIGGLLDLLLRGVPLGFIVPYLNVNTLSSIIYLASSVPVASYIGVSGLKELVIEKRWVSGVWPVYTMVYRIFRYNT